MTMTTTIIKMAIQIATLRSGPTRAARQWKEKDLVPAKLVLQYLQVRA